MYQALYRSFRPETFDTLLGQEYIAKILQNQISGGTTGHAYLFCGTRGTGKTTVARLLAKGLNCTAEGQRPCGKCAACKAIAEGTFLDVMEIDAASNNGIDDIRDLRESVNYPPAMGKCKVYIIDEVHELSSKAFDALLKTLEEPPANTVFILATTAPEKLPITILSRCMRFDFRRIPEEMMAKRFYEIVKEIGREADYDAIELIAADADGSVRDGLSLLDRCLAGTEKVTRDDVIFLLGKAGTKALLKLTDDVIRKDVNSALTDFSSILAEGKEALQLSNEWIEHLRNLLIINVMDSPEKVLNLSRENIDRLRDQAKAMNPELLRHCITELSSAVSDARYAPRARIIIELAIIKMCR